jgi:hypothetical protein
MYTLAGDMLFEVIGSGQCITGIYQSYLAISLARIADERKVQPTDIWLTFKHSLVRTYLMLRSPSLMLLWILSLSILANITWFVRDLIWSPELPFLRFIPVFPAFRDNAAIDWLLSPHSPLRGGVFATFHSLGAGGLLCFALGVMFGRHKGAELAATAEMAFMQNFTPLVYAAIVSFAAIMAAVFIPFLAPVVCVLFPVFSYVVTCDVFENGRGSRRRSEKKVRNSSSKRQPALG